MGIFIGAFLTSLGILAAALIFQIRRERTRNEDFRSLELEANCLLTRHPLVFLSGSRSVFKIFDHWNRIPRFLREHGYEVLVLEPPPGLGVDVQASLIRALDDLPEAAHLIADTSLEEPLEAISRLKHDKIASLTLIRNAEATTVRSPGRRLDPSSLRPPAHAIENFELRSAEKAARTASDTAALALLSLHNLFIQARGQSAIDPTETGELSHANDWAIEKPFLKLAVQLAERDLQAGLSPDDIPSAPAASLGA